MKYFIEILSIIISFLLGYFEEFSAGINENLIAAGIGGLIIVSIQLVFEIINNKSRLLLVLKCFFLSLKKEKIRFSMSYLYLIQVEDKYLLVKNSNFDHYQLVGGKYKRLSTKLDIAEKNFGATDDHILSNSGTMRDDFAVFVPAKNAIKFIDWFNSQKDREISHWREFYEELIKAKILSKKIFPYVNYDFMGRVVTPIKETEGWDCKEILQYDILKLIPNAEQKNALKELLEKGDTDYIKWADAELINNLGFDKRQRKSLYKIGSHTKWALNMAWTKV